MPHHTQRDGRTPPQRIRGAKRSLRAILAIALPGVLLVAASAQLAPERYTADALIQIAAGGDLQPIPYEQARHKRIDFPRHVRLIESAEVAERVIAELALPSPVLHEPRDLFELVARRVGEWLPGPPQVGRISDVRAYQALLEIEPDPSESVIRVFFSTGDPTLSAKIVNAHARIYAEIAAEQSPRLSGIDQRGLAVRVERAAEQVASTRAALDAHRSRYDIASIEIRSNAVITRLSQLDRRHVAAEAELQRLADQVELVEAGQFDALPAVTASDLVWHLKESAAQLRAQRARLQAEFRPDADQLSAVESRLRGVRRRLSAKLAAISQQIRDQHAAAAETEEAVRAQLEEQRTLAEELEGAVTTYSRLERELVSYQRDHRELEQQLQAEVAKAEGPAFEVQLVKAATPPRVSTRAGPLTFAGALLLSLACAAFFTLRRRREEPNFGTLEQVETLVGLPALGALPDFRRSAEDEAGLADQSADPHKEGTERALIRRQGMDAFREIRRRILASTPEQPPCTLLFAGATRGAGNTSVALNIAALLSQLNKPVLVVDADFRSARCHEVLRAQNEIGLTDVLTRHVEPGEVIRPISEHLSLLPAGPMPPDPTALLASTEMAECLINLQKHYAYIVVDGPPLLPASDSLLLSPLFDGVIMVADQPSSARGVVQRAAEALHAARARTLGIVVNRAPFSLPSQDAYA
jgi:capsular exopolysaccharide synthesis family protein